MPRLDADIRELATLMQQRRKEARKRVAAQEICGMRFMAEADVGDAADRNYGRIGQREPEEVGSPTDLADAANYALELIRRAND